MEETEFDTQSEKVKEIYGNTLKTILPSGGTVAIREQNGNDDDTLSNPVWAKDGSNVNLFIASIVIFTDFTVNAKLTLEDVLNMKVRDKYHILFMSRIHSNGNLINFEWDWGKENGGKKTYSEDLYNYVYDYSKPFPDPLDENYSDNIIKPYLESKETFRKFILKSGKEVRYKYADGHTEKFLLKLPKEKMTRNAEFTARGLELLADNKWEKVSNFTPFSTRDMKELRMDLKIYDPTFQGLTKLENPTNDEVVEIPIIASPDFFYPEEI